MNEKATFAAGCFWGVEDAFMQVPGVLSTEVGYIGGHTPNPTYEQVCSGQTGYAEAVQLTFDPSVVSYEHLVSLFWSLHDPTTMNRQGPDIGTQYRSAIFFHTPEQEATALAVKLKLSEAGRSKNLSAAKPLVKQIVTQIVPAGTFYPAEEYHQQYNLKHGRSCSIH